MRHADVKRLTEQGLRAREIALRLNVPVWAVYRLKTKFGLGRRSLKRRIREFVAALPHGSTAALVADRLGCSVWAVRNAIRTEPGFDADTCKIDAIPSVTFKRAGKRGPALTPPTSKTAARMRRYRARRKARLGPQP